MSGRLSADGTAVVDDPSEAGAVYGRGFFGTPEDGRLSLERTESVYLSEMGRLELVDERGRPVGWTVALRRAVRAEPEFPVRYLVYRDLRQRGYVVRAAPPPARFAVLPRGGILNKTPARFWVEPISERDPFDLAALSALGERARAARKTLLLGVVDEESDLTYYRLGSPAPRGAHPVRAPDRPFEALLTDDRVIVVDPAAVEFLGRGQGFGSRVGGRLELSLVEASFLGGSGALEFRSIGSRRPVALAQLERRARRLDPQFDVRSSAYRWLRSRGLVVKTGFKYGAHFRAYVRDPDHSHARYLVEAAPEDHRGPWPVVAGHVRLAQGVRKEFLFGSVSADGTVRCLGLQRIRP